MLHARAEEGTITVRVVGWLGLSAPLVRVFIDDREVGLLRDRHAQAFTAPVGTHRVVVKRDFFRSQPLDVVTPAGGRAELECGFGVGRSLVWLETVKLLFILVLAATLALILTTGLPLWSLWVVLAAEAVAFGVIWWRRFVPPGQYLFLHAVPPMVTGPAHRAGPGAAADPAA